MKKVWVLGCVILLALATVASDGQRIEDIPWDGAHIKQLRALGKHPTFQFFIRQADPDNEMEWTESSISWDYAWYPAGHGKYGIAIHWQFGSDIGYLTIYWQDAPGKIRS